MEGVFFLCAHRPPPSVALAFLNGAGYCCRQQVTQGTLGVIEYVISCGVGGMVYAAFGGQPMTFIGPTGLTLAFMTALYRCSTLLHDCGGRYRILVVVVVYGCCCYRCRCCCCYYCRCCWCVGVGTVTGVAMSASLVVFSGCRVDAHLVFSPW